MEFSRLQLSAAASVSLIFFFSGLFLPIVVNSVVIGINYGQIGNNLPSPKNAVALVKSMGATKVKLYDANPEILKAFCNTGVELVIGLGNEYLSQMADPDKAQAWVKSNVKAYLPATKITAITVGNEVLTFNQTSLSGCLLPAMQNIHSALVKMGLNKQIYVTTPHSLALLQTSYPPSVSVFRRDLVDSLTPIFDFQLKSGSPFLINAYPFFAYKESPKHVSLDFVLFQPSQGFTDPGTNLHYDNMLFAQVDAVYHALSQAGYKKLPVVVSETGWPSNGDVDEAGATCDNAKKYNGNLLKMMMGKKMRTPLRPDCDLSVYVFALFNENMKPGPSSERNYGLFKPDTTPVYSLGFKLNNLGAGAGAGGGGGSNNNFTGGNGSFARMPTPTDDDSTNGYLSISSSAERSEMLWRVVIVLTFMLKLYL